MLVWEFYAHLDAYNSKMPCTAEYQGLISMDKFQFTQYVKNVSHDDMASVLANYLLVQISC